MFDPIPVSRLVAAVMLGTLPPLVLAIVVLVILSETGGSDALRIAGTLAPFMIGAAALLGIPAAAIFLRNPATRPIWWAVTGAATALLALSLVEIWIFGFSAPLMLFTFAGPILLVLNGTTLVLGALAGLSARYAAVRLSRAS